LWVKNGMDTGKGRPTGSYWFTHSPASGPPLPILFIYLF
jgi:hypothetical protein